MNFNVSMSGLRPIRGRSLPKARRWSRGVLLAAQLAVLAVVVVLWEGAARLGLISAFLWSTPAQVAAAFGPVLRAPSLPVDLAYTVGATLLGFAVGTALGALFGLSFWWSRNYAQIAMPFLVVFNAIPKIALGPILILVFGIGLGSKVALAVTLTFVVTAVATFNGVRRVDEDGQNLLYAFGATRPQVFNAYVLPSVLPWIVSTLNVNIGLALIGVIVGEFIATEHGLGRVILYAGQTYDMATIWVGVLLLSLVATLMFLVASWFERLLMRQLGAGSES